MLVRQLIWDNWNIAHIARHSVMPAEVEELCQADPQTEVANKGRIRITGATNKGRIISAFLDPEPDTSAYYTVSARDASKKERRSYQAWIKEKG
ncbi:MAG TPA: hypothetical protein VNE40_01105 [Candidatus Dormibacteraeota bacterium]|nr:hypothetical protein [Candidatus Dormibacteraeota bacterium]